MSESNGLDGILASKIKTLEAELKGAVASLRAEREAKSEAIARLTAEKEEALAQLEVKDEFWARKLKMVVVEIDSDTTNQAKRRRLDSSSSISNLPFDRDNPRVKKVGLNVLSENTTTHTCRTKVTIHEEPQVLLEALLGDQTKGGKMLFQKVVEKGVAYWSFMVEGTTKCCGLLLCMRVERQDEDGVVVRVESAEEEGESGDEGMKQGMESRLNCVIFAELEAISLPNPHSTALKRFRLLLKEGTIVLRPLQFGQVRGRDERSDELISRVHGIPVLMAALVGIVAAILANV